MMNENEVEMCTNDDYKAVEHHSAGWFDHLILQWGQPFNYTSLHRRTT